jgi:hypothetical protein
MLRDNQGISSGGAGGPCTLGIPSDGTYADGFFNYWTSMYSCSNAFDDINEVLLKLLPSKPYDLSMIPLQFNNTYSAREESSFTVHNPCTDDTTPRAYAVDFYDGNAGDLSCEIDTVDHGLITITTNDDTGLTDGYLTVTDDSDPYFGQSGKEGFWHQLSADIIPSTALTYARHVFAMNHSVSGTAQQEIWVDNPITATINNPSDTLPTACTRYISGVPSLEVADTIGFTSQLLHAVGKHYHINYVATINSPQTTSTNFDVSVAPAENSIINIADDVDIINNVYSENVTLVVTPYNSKEACTATNHQTGARVDTVSMEVRVRSGSGQFPAIGNGNADFGDTYVSATSLKTVPYDTELQLLNGRFQRPTGNYTSNLPTNGPDYSTGMGTAMRYVTFHSISITNKSGLNLVFNNTAGLWSGVETSGIEIWVRVEGSTGWLNGNMSYPGVGSPSNDNDYAMVFASSTPTVKRITFGPTVRTGVVYIRVGIPSGSDKQFGNITVTEI